MIPIGHTIKSMPPQPLNLEDKHTGVSLQASDILKKLIDKVSLGILSSEGKKSTIVSPASLTPVLGMLLACIDDNAKKESILGIPKGTLTKELETEIHKELGKFSKDNPYGSHPDQLISCANFIASAYQLSHEQLEKILSECYQTQKLESDFWDVAEVTEAYVKEKTKGKIKKLFDGWREIRVAIGNVMEFRGVWEDSFSPDKTAPGRILCADGTFIDNVKMMSKIETVQCASNKKFRAIAKEFQSFNGEDLKLVAITPRQQSATAIDDLDSDTINELIEQLNYNEAKYQVTLPKIKVVDSCDTKLLEKICEALGTDIIVAGDLTRLGIPADLDLEVLQKIVLSVDEEGASGTMATVAAVTARSGGFGFSKFSFDCPGYMAIVNKEGKRLIELVVKDGSFLEFVGDPVITTAEKPSSDKVASSYFFDLSESEDDMSDYEGYSSDCDDDSSYVQPAYKKELLQKDLSLITSLSFRIFETADVSTYINKIYNPDGRFNITSAEATDRKLKIKLSSLDDAEKLQEIISESIGEKDYMNSVRLSKGLVSFDLDVSIGGWLAIIKIIS